MRKYYYVVSEHENGKNYAFALTVNDCNNLLSIFGNYKHAEIVHPCASRIKAEELALNWNNAYKENGTYMFQENNTINYRLGLNETLRVVKQSLRNSWYQVFTNNGNIYVADISYGNVVHHRDGRITYKDCYLVKDEYIKYDDNLNDYSLQDCGGKEYKVVIQEENLFGFAKIRKYRGVK